MAVTFTAAADGTASLVGAEDQGFALVSGLLNIGTYATNGVAIAYTDFTSDARFDTLVDCIIQSMSVDGTTLYSVDLANSKVEAYSVVDGTEVTNATDLSAAGKSFRALAILS